MSPSLFRLALIAALGVAPMAMAQTDTTTTTDTATGTTTDSTTGTTAADPNAAKPADNGTGFQTGQNAEPAGSTYSRKAIGDWDLRCVRAKAGEQSTMDPCQLYQLLKDDKGNSVAEISLFGLDVPNGPAVAGATIITPLETLLTREITITIDGANPKRYAFSWCSVVGCYARVGFTQAEIDAFQKGSKAQLVIVPAPAPDTNVSVTMSLSGFTAGYKAVNEHNAKAAAEVDAAKKAAEPKK